MYNFFNNLSNPLRNTRALSESISDQGQFGTCTCHSNAKILLHNRFLFVMPISVNKDIYNDKQCNQFLNTGIDETTIKNLNSLTPEMCSSGGYDKILLFLYLFFLFSEKLKDTSKICKRNINDINYDLADLIVPDVLSHNIHLPRLEQLLIQINDKSIGFRWYEWYIEINKDNIQILFTMIDKITKQNFYVQLSTQSHALTIVGTRNRNYIIKNSWGYPEDIIPMDLTQFNLPGMDKPAIGQFISFYLPIPKGSNIFKEFGHNPSNPIVYYKLILFAREIDIYCRRFRRRGGTRRRHKTRSLIR
jgi:hypothetical protein